MTDAARWHVSCSPDDRTGETEAMQQEITRVLDQVLEPIERHVLGLGALSSEGPVGALKTRRRAAGRRHARRRVEPRRRPAPSHRASAALERGATPATATTATDAVRILCCSRT
jgi:hypothetical protein